MMYVDSSANKIPSPMHTHRAVETSWNLEQLIGPIVKWVLKEDALRSFTM